MSAGLPFVYAALIVAELVYLIWRYRFDAPRSSDPFSIWLGWIGLAAMVIMLVYSIARRSRGLRNIARLSHWLHFHIFLGVLGVIAVSFHSLHVLKKIAGGALNPLNPGFLCLIAVLVVFFSGIYGRYMYSLLPRKKSGEQMAIDEVTKEMEATADPSGTLAERRVMLERRVAAYEAAERIFRRWIVLHRPLAAIMYVISAVHVILSYMFTPIR
jgi:hypothetical protein